MTIINKNKINDALILLESEAKKPTKEMKDKLKQKLLLESSEEDLELDALAQEELNDEEETNIEDIDIEDEENLEDEIEEEDEEYIDVTGGISEKDGTFTIQTTAEVALAPGNKIKFFVGDEEFKGTVGEPIGDEEGVLSIEVDEDEETSEGEEDLTDIEDEENSEDEELTDDDIIEEVLLEEELGTDELEDTDEEGLEDLDNMGTDELGDAGEEGLEDLDNIDMNLGSSGGMGSETDLGGEETEEGFEDSDNTETDLEQIVDTDELINELIGREEENPLDVELVNHLQEEILDEEISNIISEVLKESKENPNYKKATNEEKPATSLGDKDITNKVKDSTDKQTVPGVKGFKANPVAKQTDVQSKKLKTEEPTSTVSKPKVKTSKTNPEDIISKVGKGGDSHVDPKDDFTSKVKQDSAIKSKALVKLAEDLVKVQNEVKQLRFENYKLLKVNGLLTLLPDLEQKTRETLCEKFDKCTSDTQVLSLYNKVKTIVKESRKPNLNQLVTTGRNNVQSFSKTKEHDIKTLKETVDKMQNNNNVEELTDQQKRINHLMGLDKGENYYKNLK